MNNLLLIGPPGSGKGTQSSLLVKKYGYKHISTGDLLRSEVSKKSDLGNKIKSVMDSGSLVSDELVAELLIANIDLENNHYIFDGFPRNVEQADIFSKRIMRNYSYISVLFDMNLVDLTKRIINRRVSEDGHHIYNLISNPPTNEGICDVTGQKLIQRKDDKEDVVFKRMNVYKSETSPMVDYFKEMRLLKTIDADKAISDVTEQLINIIEEE